jgi:hypothetical protein
MKKNGSIYVAAVFAALVAYFVYQWWFNPNRKVKARLGEIAGALSVPADEGELGRVARLAQLRRFISADVHVKIGREGADITSREGALAAAGSFRPAGGWNLDFVDVDIRVNPDDTARAFATADASTRDPRTGTQTLDSRDVSFLFVKRDGDWLVKDAEVKDLPKTP